MSSRSFTATRGRSSRSRPASGWPPGGASSTTRTLSGAGRWSWSARSSFSVGNRLPKTLTPLAAMRCDPARVQAFQRTVGRQWVITGLVFIATWVQLPLALARPFSIALLAACMAATVWQLVRLRAGR